MTLSHPRRIAYTVVALMVYAPTRPAAAQVGPTLLLKPWQEGNFVEGNADASVFGKGHTDSGEDDSFRLVIYDGGGRFRIDPEAEHSLAVGFAVTYMDLRSGDETLPERLVDQQFAVAVPLFKWDDWEIGAVVGGGHASDNPFADGDGFFGRADLIASRKLDERSSLLVSLSYNGNRTLWPDIPIPTFAYSHAVSDTFRYTIGIPYSSFTWQPADKWTVSASYTPPYSLDAEVAFAMLKELTLFAAFQNRYDAFHLNGDDDHRRLFFQQRRLEAGLRWRPCQACELVFAGGYAFGQEFDRGYDARDTSTVREITDEPYIRAGVNFEF